MVVKEILLPEAFYVHELEGDNGHDNPTHGRAETSRVDKIFCILYFEQAPNKQHVVLLKY